MDRVTPGRSRRRLGLGVLLAVLACALIAGPTGAVPPGWTAPRRVFADDGGPWHSAVRDAAGRTHIAVERGSEGIFYVTDAFGSWRTRRISCGDDHDPSLVVSGDIVYVAFARQTAGQEGIYTTSSAAPAAACGWQVVRRWEGVARQPSLGAYGTTLHVAFRTADRALRYRSGAADDPSWRPAQVVDRTCCTSAPSLALTHLGSPRVAYGDLDDSGAAGLRFAAPATPGWTRGRIVPGGRITYVALVLDHTPGIFGPPSNAPHVAYVVARQGAYLVTKPTPDTSGGWGTRSLGRHLGPLDLHHYSNRTTIVYGGGGKLWVATESGGIFYTSLLSRSGHDGRPQILVGNGTGVTFARSEGTTGVYVTHTH